MSILSLHLSTLLTPAKFIQKSTSLSLHHIVSSVAQETSLSPVHPCPALSLPSHVALTWKFPFRWNYYPPIPTVSSVAGSSRYIALSSRFSRVCAHTGFHLYTKAARSIRTLNELAIIFSFEKVLSRMGILATSSKPSQVHHLPLYPTPQPVYTLAGRYETVIFSAGQITGYDVDYDPLHIKSKDIKSDPRLSNYVEARVYQVFSSLLLGLACAYLLCPTTSLRIHICKVPYRTETKQTFARRTPL
ncbi:hypothetical protein BDQ17DRAFT_114533 [Cyathus striatus]|nr:hypothetical protein BDQ17DRAFT_114533 [Cyathus striatus]